MIKKTTTIETAICDACEARLVDKLEPHNLNRGILRNDFGYGAKPASLDPMGSNVEADYDLCGECFVKACHAVGLPAHDDDKGGNVSEDSILVAWRKAIKPGEKVRHISDWDFVGEYVGLSKKPEYDVDVDWGDPQGIWPSYIKNIYPEWWPKPEDATQVEPAKVTE